MFAIHIAGLNSPGPGNAYIGQLIGSSMLQGVACLLSDVKPLPKPLLTKCWFRESNCKMSPANFRPFCPVLNELIAASWVILLGQEMAVLPYKHCVNGGIQTTVIERNGNWPEICRKEAMSRPYVASVTLYLQICDVWYKTILHIWELSFIILCFISHVHYLSPSKGMFR